MLHCVSDLKGYSLNATDGSIGEVEDFYFDDQKWTIRYLVVDTGRWLPGRKVLISPRSVAKADRENQMITVHLNKQQIENSPGIDTDKPVSRQYETLYNDYYGFPYYWGGPHLWGPAILPSDASAPVPPTAADEEIETRRFEHESDDPHLRSAGEVTGYYIEATNGEIGHVQDFIVDDETWAIRYLLIDTKNWWPGKKVVVSPGWIERVSWSDSRVYVNESRENIRHAPEYKPDESLHRDYENKLHRHYNRAPYWD